MKRVASVAVGLLERAGFQRAMLVTDGMLAWRLPPGGTNKGRES